MSNDRQKMRTKLALIKEKSETMMCQLLDSNSEIISKLKDVRSKQTSNLVQVCIDIVMAELTYIMYNRALDNIDENTGGKNENISDW